MSDIRGNFSRGSGSGSRGGRGAGRGGPSRGGGGYASNQTALTCYNCRQTGHMSRECPEAINRSFQSYPRGRRENRGSSQRGNRGYCGDGADFGGRGAGGYRGGRTDYSSTAEHAKPLKALKTVQAVDNVKREFEGTLGQKIKLIVNYFKMAYGKHHIYNYHIYIYNYNKEREVKKEIKSRKFMQHYFWKFVKQNEKLFGTPSNLLYDDKSQLYSWKKLDIEDDLLSLDLELEEEGCNKFLLLEIKPIKSNSPINVDFNILNLALTQYARCPIEALSLNFKPRVYCEKDRIYMLPCTQYMPLDLNYHLEMFKGLRATAKKGPANIALANYDVVHSSFQRTNVDILVFYSMVKTGKELTEADLKNMQNYGLDNAQRREMRMLLSGLKLQSKKMQNIQPRTYNFCDVLQQSAKSAMFNHITYDQDGRLVKEESISVEEYYFRRNKVRLKYPNMPLIQCGPREKNLFFPIEALHIHDTPQRLRSKLPDELQAKTNAFTSREPKFRFNDINDMMESVEVERDPFLAQANITVDMNMLEIEGRELTPPKCTFNLPFNAQKKARAVQAPQYELVFSVVVVNRCIEIDENFKNSVDALIEDCRLRGIKFAQIEPLEELDYYYNASNSLNDYLLKRKEHATRKFPNAQLMLIVVVRTADDRVYNSLKAECEVKLGIMTQVLLSKTFRKLNDKPALQNPVTRNIFLKINAKMGGINNKIEPNTQHWKKFIDPKKPTLFIGIDVTHPPPGDSDFPSISALVGNIDVEATKYTATVRAQDMRVEAIKNMREMCKEQILCFKKLNAERLPAHIVVFRDGVSESQFDQVIKQEIKDLSLACKDVQKGYAPNYTVVIVQKRHSTRFYAPDTGARGSNGNCPQGTVVDKYITGENVKEFYLCSHKGMLGTSRPAHYYVIYDDWGLSADELQSCAYNLCHLFARAAMPVSLPAPVYYAHLVCYRARRHFIAQRDNSARPEDIKAMVHVKEYIKEKMYFC